MVFTFPSNKQKVVENGTAVMEIEWRWLNKTLEMIIKVNDDDLNENYSLGYVEVDQLGLLFDSNRNGILGDFPPPSPWSKDSPTLDHGVFAYPINRSGVWARCFVHIETSPSSQAYYNNTVMHHWYSSSDLDFDFIAEINDTLCLYNEGEGYTFKLSIPRELINVEPPTPIHISFIDFDAVDADRRAIYATGDIHKADDFYKDSIAASFTG